MIRLQLLDGLDDKMTFSELLNQKLGELKVSLNDFAREVTLAGYPVAKSTISLWSSGKRSPKLLNPVVRNAIAHAMKIDVNTLLTSLDLMVVDDERSPEALYGANLIDLLSPEKKRFAIDMLERLTE